MKALRLWAWQYVADPTDPMRQAWEPFNCSRDCIDHDGDYSVRARALRGCVRADLPAIEWHVDARLIVAHYLGREPSREFAGTRIAGLGVDWRLPPEDPAEGCPRAWWSTPFCAALVPYLRARTRDGGRVQNPRFDACEDRLVVDAVLYFEREQERAIHEIERRRQEHLERQRDR